jgi:hypothetical protein
LDFYSKSSFCSTFGAKNQNSCTQQQITTTTLTSLHHMSKHDSQKFGATQQPTKKLAALQYKLD